jgi:hypothetical protein
MRLLEKEPPEQEIQTLVLGTRGCNVIDLVNITGKINNGASTVEALAGHECYAEKLVKSLY